MAIAHRIFLLIVTLSLISCASPRGFPDREVSIDEELDELKIFSRAKIDEYKASKNEEERMRIRNDYINARIEAIDAKFFQFEEKMYRENIALNLGTDAIILGSGAAGALVSGGASQILSAASAAVIGMKGSIDKKIFYEKTLPALFAQMEAQRQKILANIQTNLLNNTTAYSLWRGRVDLQRYRRAGSIDGAISATTLDAAAKIIKADEDLDKILPFKPDEGAISLEKWLGPLTSSGEFDSEKVKKIKACWKKTGVPESTLFIDFILESTYAAKRLEVRECVDKPVISSSK